METNSIGRVKIDIRPKAVGVRYHERSRCLTTLIYYLWNTMYGPISWAV